METSEFNDMPQSWFNVVGLSFLLPVLVLSLETSLAQEVIRFQHDPELVRPKVTTENLVQELGPLPLLFEDQTPAGSKNPPPPAQVNGNSETTSSNGTDVNRTQQVSYSQAGQEPATIPPAKSLNADLPTDQSPAKAMASRSAAAAYEQQVTLARRKIQERAAREALERAQRLDARRHPAAHAPARPPFLNGKGQPISSNGQLDQAPQFTKW